MKEHVYIRPTIFVEKGGYESEPSRMKTGYYIVVVPISSNLDQIKSQTAAISRYRKVPITSFPAGIKAGAMYGLTRLARLDAQHQGADEALLLNETGHLTETPGANIFVVTQGRLYTPPISDGILDGVTRRNLLSLAQHDLCLDVHEQSITPEQVYGSSEAFVCGTLSQITGLSVVNRHPIPRSPGPIALELARLYYGICHGPQGINHDWITEFDLTSGRFV
jgi:branched-chain amino acid aminotransferase